MQDGSLKEFVHGVCHTKDMLTVCSLTLKYVRTAELWIEKMSNRFQLNFGLSFECVQCFGNLFNSVLNVEHALSLVWSSSDASYNLPPRQYQCGYATISGFKTITSKPLTSNMITNTNHHHHHHTTQSSSSWSSPHVRPSWKKNIMKSHDRNSLSVKPQIGTPCDFLKPQEITGDIHWYDLNAQCLKLRQVSPSKHMKKKLLLMKEILLI